MCTRIPAHDETVESQLAGELSIAIAESFDLFQNVEQAQLGLVPDASSPHACYTVCSLLLLPPCDIVPFVYHFETHGPASRHAKKIPKEHPEKQPKLKTP
jgi:hypothetical protein